MVKHPNTDNIYKKITLFLLISLLLILILKYGFPGSIEIFSNNFEYILLGVILILTFLVIMSISNISFDKSNKNKITHLLSIKI